ncbi:MAG: fasciclin domain-containing protein [Bacteroidota bacterium]
MKKILSFLAASLLLLNLFVSTGCEDDSSDPLPNVPPTLIVGSSSDVTEGGTITVDPGTIVNVQLIGTAGTDDLETMRFQENGAAMDINNLPDVTGGTTMVGSATALIDAGDASGFTWDAAYTVSDVSGTYDFSVILTDAGGLTSTVNFTVEVMPTITASSIWEAISTSADHTFLTTSLTEAGLQDVLTNGGPFTVFAPTDNAFTNLPNDILAVLGVDGNGFAANLLLHHVVDGSVPSSALSDQQVITSLAGLNATVSINGGAVMIDNALVTVADINTGNGVVHVVDAVIIPPVINLTGVLFNAAGPQGTGGLNLLTGESVNSGDVTATIKDEGIDIGAPDPSTNWRRQISGANGNSIRYVDESALPEMWEFDAANSQTLIADAWNTGIDFTQMNSGGELVSDEILVGDLLVVDTGSGYFLIRIDDLIENTTTGNPQANDDYYEMSVKY